MMRGGAALAAVHGLWLLSATGGVGQVQSLDPAAWRKAGEARVETVDGGAVLYLRSGRVLRTDISFQDGTIEFEMRPTDRRAFLGLVFRVESSDQAEDVYFRLHKSLLPDAIQYSPDYGGRGQWQLYHGPTATAAARFVPGAWQRVRVEVRGAQAAVFVGNEMREPQLVIDQLRSGASSGGIGFWGNQPGATGDDPPSALVRNVIVRHGQTSYAFPEPEPEPNEPDVIRRWGVSTPFLREGSAALDLPAAVLDGTWQEVPAEASGLVPLDRHVRLPAGGVGTVLAGLRIQATAPRVAWLDLGFSDDVVAFVNGEPVYAARNGFSTNFPRRQGLITLDQASLPLRLMAGENRVILAVSEVYGGWGLIGRMVDRAGLTIEPLGKGR